MSEETTLLIKLPKDLKVLYQALCKTNGVTVSSQLRDFIRSEISYATMPQNAARKPQIDARTMPKPKKVSKPQKQAKKPQQANLAFSESFAQTIGSNMTKKKINNKK